MAVLIARAPSSLGTTASVLGTAGVAIGWGVLALVQDHHSGAAFAAMWLAMTIAMMLPSVLRPMMRAADGGSARALSFAGGFTLAWLVAGVPAYVLLNAVHWTPFWVTASWIAAGLWLLSPLGRRAVGSCGSIPFAGRPARYGLQQGVRCVTSCWLLMIAAMATAMLVGGAVVPLLIMLGVSALVCWEKSPRTSPRAVASVGLALVLAAGGAFVLAGGGPAGHHQETGTSTS